MTIATFISEVRTRGLARTNRYQLEIPFPSNTVDRDSSYITNLLCESVQIPGLNIATTPVRVFGEAREMPYEKTYEPITTTFYVDSTMKVKTAFDNWTSLIINPQTRTLGYYKDYIRDITIHVNTVDDMKAMTIVVSEAYPKTVSAIQLDSNAKEIMKLSVTWQYKYWTSTNNNVTPAQSIPPTYYRGDADVQGILTGRGMPLLFDEPVATEAQISAIENITG